MRESGGALPEQGGVDVEVIRAGQPQTRARYCLCDLAALHEHAETAGGEVGFRDQDEATGFAVQAVDDGDLAAVR